MALSDAQQCNATAKSTGERCQNPAVTGSTKCRLHGGKSPKGVTHPRFKNGRYSKYASADLSGKLAAVAHDPELLSLRDEIDLMTGLIATKIEKLDTGESGKAWEKAKTLIKQARKGYKGENYGMLEDSLDSLEDLADGRILHYETEKEIRQDIEQRRKLTESERKRLESMDQMLSAEETMAIMQALVQSVRRNVDDPAKLNAIQTDFIMATERARLSQPQEVEGEA